MSASDKMLIVDGNKKQEKLIKELGYVCHGKNFKGM